ncbi:hypothetical protein DEU56DRAFT_699184, partial [Suillus clintonianus]|uniref:uncharacterized protein n=1 Tax=Suillus clintonianus TaxID=1904413 RepID=UPI001B866FA8
VRRLLKDIFSISQDADFIVHQPAIHEDVYSYEYKDGPGPDTQNLAFDLTHGSNTPWNARILNMLVEELQRRNVEEQWPFQRSDGYYKAILEDRYKRLWTAWRAAQPKTLGDGGMSSEESDVENDVQCVLRVKNMAWRRRIERELNVIDHQRVLDDDVF